MKLVFADAAWEDYLYWQKQDRKMVERINKLIRDIQREPYSGVGNQRMIELGWEVKRFWVYELRDRLPKCVEWVRAWNASARREATSQIENQRG